MPKCTECGHKEPAMRCICEKCLSEFAAYKATGLSPEDCAEYKKFEDNLIASGMPFSRMIELIKAAQEDDSVRA